MLFAYAFNSNCKFGFKKALFKYQNREFVFWVGDEVHCEVIQTFIEYPEKEHVFNMINDFLHRFGYINKSGFEFRGAFSQTTNSKTLIDAPLIVHAERAPKKLRVEFTHFSDGLASLEVKQALSLLNDAEYSINPWFKFLCYWKIISLRKEAHTWISANVDRFRGLSFYNNLLSQGVDIVKFFSDQCRNAVTHVNRAGNKELYSYSLEDYHHIQGACFSIEPFVKAYINEVLYEGQRRVPIEISRIE